MTSAGKPSNGSPKPDGASVQAALLSPEMCIVVVIGIVPMKVGMKADALQKVEGSSPGCVMREYTGHHRGLRPGHVYIGVAWELGRAICLLAE